MLAAPGARSAIVGSGFGRSRSIYSIARDPIAEPLMPSGDLLGVVCRCAGIGGVVHLAVGLVVGVAGPELLGDGVDIAEAGLGSFGAEAPRGARAAVGGPVHPRSPTGG